MVQSGRVQGFKRSGAEAEDCSEDGQANEHEALRVKTNLTRFVVVAEAVGEYLEFSVLLLFRLPGH